jgi:hypothetical protein
MTKQKKTYTAPKVVLHGSVSRLTFGAGGSVADGGGMSGGMAAMM